MLRVVLGHARPDIEWSRKSSDLHFSSAPRVQKSTRSRGATSMILTVPRSCHGEEVDLEVNQESELRTEPLNWEERMGRTNEEKVAV
jgi:hypothetical protein